MPLDCKDYSRMASKRYLRFWPIIYFDHHFLKKRVVFVECSWQGRTDLLQVDQQLLLAGLGCAKAREPARKLFRSSLFLKEGPWKCMLTTPVEFKMKKVWGWLKLCRRHPKAFLWTHQSTGPYGRCPRGCLQQQSDHPVQRLLELYTSRGDGLRLPWSL